MTDILDELKAWRQQLRATPSSERIVLRVEIARLGRAISEIENLRAELRDSVKRTKADRTSAQADQRGREGCFFLPGSGCRDGYGCREKVPINRSAKLANRDPR